MKEFTAEELTSLNGKDGRPVFIAFQGKVFDVTKSPLWAKGLHMNRHPRVRTWREKSPRLLMEQRSLNDIPRWGF